MIYLLISTDILSSKILTRYPRNVKDPQTQYPQLRHFQPDVVKRLTVLSVKQFLVSIIRFLVTKHMI